MQDKAGAVDHIRNHQTYPATKADLVAACNNLDHFSEEDKMWFKENLPDRTYSSAEEVIEALGL